MTYATPHVDRESRSVAAAAVLVVHVILAYAIISGLAERYIARESPPMTTFDVPLEMPPPETEPQERVPVRADRRPVGPARPEAQPAAPGETPVVEPQPAGLRPLPVAPAPNDWQAAAGTGLAGRGAAGAGAGGQAGSGTGGGGGGGSTAVATSARRIAGFISGDDYPRSALRSRAEGTTGVSFTVGADGRVSKCSITRSSGSADLDRAVCTLISKRYRYEPARNASGNPVPETVSDRIVWRLPLFD